MLSTRGLARRVEIAEALVALKYAETLLESDLAATVDSIRVAGARAVFAGINSPLSRVVGLGMRGPVSERALDRLEDFYASYGSDVVIDLCPFADPSLLEILRSRPYAMTEFNQVLANPLVCDTVPAAPQGVQVCEAGPEEASSWAHFMLQGFFGRGGFTRELTPIAEVLFRTPGGRGYWGLLEGETAGTAAMIVTDNQVGVFFGDSTKEDSRRQGVQSALIRHRLKESLANDCELCVASVLPGTASHRNYERAGFQNLFTRAVLRRPLQPEPTPPPRVV